jgi:hypothetical protein
VGTIQLENLVVILDLKLQHHLGLFGLMLKE